MRGSVLGSPLLNGGYGTIPTGPGADFDRGKRSRGARGRGLEARNRLSLFIGLRGLLAILFGLSALVWPSVTVVALAMLFGIYAVVDGAGMIASGLARQVSGERRWLYLLAGIIGISAGLLAALWPQLTAMTLVLLSGVWALVTGALEVAAAVRLRRELTGQWLLAAVGVISMLAGVLIFLRPDVGVLALATVLGAYALTTGVALLATAWWLRKAHLVIVDVPDADL